MKEGFSMVRGQIITVSPDRLTAMLHLKASEIQNDDIKKVIENSILKANITYGLDHALIAKIVEDPQAYTYPIEIAKGEKPIAGRDAYLVKEKLNLHSEKREKLTDIHRHMLTVTNGEVVATIFPATPGTDGIDVHGHRVNSMDGRELHITPGENVIFHHGQYYSLINGEVLLSKDTLSVLPIQVIDGDYHPGKGIIKFDGHVVVKGNVLTGSHIAATGNIRVEGTVENAKLEAQGYIYIEGGVLGNQYGKIQAQGSIRATFLNQAAVESASNIYIERSILHSVVVAKEHIFANNASVIGGHLSTYGELIVKDIGNHHYTYTEIELKEEDHSLQEKLGEISTKLAELNIVKQKLVSIEYKLQEDQQGHPLAVKHKKTKKHIDQEILNLTKKKQEIESHHSLQKKKLAIKILGDLYPQTKIKKGKYAKLFKKPNAHVTIHFNQSEFVVSPIEN